MKPEDIKLFADSVVNGCKVYVATVEKRMNDGLAELAKRFDALPAPKDGVDGKTPGPNEIIGAVEAVSAKQFGAFEAKAQEVVEALQKAKDESAAAAKAANEALERLALRLAEVKDGEKGQDGKDADPGAVADLLWPRVKDMIDAIPRPQDGAKGADADPEVVRSMVAEAVSALPPAERGEKGADGVVDMEAVKQLIDEAVAELPPAAKGDKGDPGESVDVHRFIEIVKTEFHEQFAANAHTLAHTLKGDKGDPGPAIAIEEVKALVDEAVAALPPAEKGDKGENGREPTPEEVKAIIVPLVAEAVAEAVAALPPPERGEPGVKGDKGDAGADADMPAILARVDELVKAIPAPANGKDADPEVVLAMVKAAVAEIPKPENGVDGLDGQRGEPGRDALQLDVLPAIDVQRVYPRGTYARHKGGVWRTFKTTTPGEKLDGWECIVDGVDTIEFKHDIGDPHKLFIGVTKSSGEQSHEHVHIPVMIYRGVFVDGKEYEQGDTVTWARSLWTCLRDTKAKPEPGSPDWQLSVKQASAGASAYDIAKKAGFVGDENQWLASLRGPKGEDGRNGIDFNRLGPNGGL